MRARDFSIKHKLTRLIMLITGIALTLACVALVGYDMVTYRTTLIRSLSILTEVVGENSIGALTFEDSGAASDALAVLRAEPQIVSACIYDKTGGVFADYHRVGSESGSCPIEAVAQGNQSRSHYFGSNEVTFIRLITFDEQSLGLVYVKAELRELQSRLTDFGGTAIIILLISSVVVIVLATRFQRVITQPIFELLDVTRAVSAQRDYSIRAKKIAEDEIGQLVDGFNGMLETVQERDLQLRESERSLISAQRLAHVGHWKWQLDSGEVQWSEEIYRIFGLSRDAFDGTEEGHRKLVHPDDLKTVLDAGHKARKGQTYYNIEYRIVRPNGSLRHIRETAEATVDPASGSIHVYGAIQDITEHVHAEESLRRVQKLEAIGQLTGGVAHDFNNLLAVMIGNAELLQDLVGDDEVAKERIDTIIETVERGSSLTHRLLAFSRQTKLSPVAVRVSNLISSLSDMLQRTLGETVDLRVEVTPDLWPATIDAHQFEDVLVNLAFNARDAMPKGGMLTIETVNVTLDEAYAERYEEVTPGDYVEVAVSDTGSGMPPEILEKVFEPFFTTKDVGKGSGLGLSMVYGFVKQSKGHITLYSEVGKGTTVKLYLPRSVEDVAQDGTEDDTHAFTQGTERILVVEDDEPVRAVSVKILQKQGYEIVEAKDGAEAIKRLKDSLDFDLLVTDVVLPGGINGAEIAEQAKRLQPNIKVLFTSGYAENAVIHNGLLDTGVILVNKPYRRTELLEKVELMLAGDAT